MDELSSPSASPPAAAVKSPSRRLKITLKLPTQKATRGRGRAPPSPTPDASRAASRDVDIESEDDDDEASAAGGSGRPMTARQAVLASVVDSSHVSLNETSRKKKQLNEAELALRREETARKRKHLSEKKLEDEKAETINRLLKKQSRPRNKRNVLASAEDRTPVTQTGAATPVDGEGDEEFPTETVTPVIEDIPTSYRWISTSKHVTTHAVDDQMAGAEDKKMTLSFAVPLAALPLALNVDDPPKMDVDEQPVKAREAPQCDVEGCVAGRKYRLVRDWQRGACGMDHLKVLERQAVA
ncbi:hypothetical protein BV25DRAFT_714575 [Artomyces pyxidatus]|uniref:Uncharacterized protein n=1 Tax=Artomyces pyxidatus TaxID=48021 RepID=A0ACB8T1C5_9AGAM|nr:hypothetical protein BV25DRAFT_714575 [Artomyces pyxidatus]